MLNRFTGRFACGGTSAPATLPSFDSLRQRQLARPHHRISRQRPHRQPRTPPAPKTLLHHRYSPHLSHSAAVRQTRLARRFKPQSRPLQRAQKHIVKAIGLKWLAKAPAQAPKSRPKPSPLFMELEGPRRQPYNARVRGLTSVGPRSSRSPPRDNPRGSAFCSKSGPAYSPKYRELHRYFEYTTGTVAYQRKYATKSVLDSTFN